MNRILKLRSIINPLAQNDLSVQLNTCFCQTLYLRKNVSSKTVVQHFAAQLGIHCMERYIDRLQMIPNNTVNIMVAHIRKRYVISLQKREPRIVIFKIQRITHALWHLIDETENTFVTAGTVFIHQRILKSNPKILLKLFLDLKLPLFSVCLSHQHCQIFFIDIIVIVKNIFNLLPVYCEKHITRLQLHLLRNTSRINAFNFMFHAILFHLLF